MKAAEREALNVLVIADQDGRWVGIHDYTSPPGLKFSTVHWHSAQTLRGLGYAAMDGPCLVLTDKGRQAWNEDW